MKKNFKCLTALILCICVSSVVMAQQSETGTTTHQLFNLDKDVYLSPTHWGLIERPVLFLQFGRPGQTPTQFDIGLGLPLGNLYGAANFNFRDESDQRTSVTVNRVWDFDDGAGHKIGDTTTTDTTYQVENNSRTALTGTFGTQIGNMDIGIANRLILTNNQRQGYLSFEGFDALPAYTIPAGVVWRNLPIITYFWNNSEAVETQVDEIVRTVLTDYSEEGKSGVKSLTNNFKTGLSMPLGAMTLHAHLGVDMVNQTNEVFTEGAHTTIEPGVGYSAYTPPNAISSPSEIEDLAAYEYQTGGAGNNLLTIAPQFGALVDIPVELGYSSIITAGLKNAELRLRSRSNNYTDLEGNTVSVSGSTRYYQEFHYTTEIPDDQNRHETTETHTRAWQAQTYDNDFRQTYELFSKIKVTPADNFSFAVGLTPEIRLNNFMYNESGKAEEVQIYTHPEDLPGENYVQTTTVTRNDTSYEYSAFRLRATLETGAQFYLIPERFRINLGGRLINDLINRVTTTQLTDSVVTRKVETEYGDGTSETEDYQHSNPADQGTTETNNLNFIGSAYTLGATYFFSEAMYLDMSSTGAEIFNLDNWTLQLVIKY